MGLLELCQDEQADAAQIAAALAAGADVNAVDAGGTSALALACDNAACNAEVVAVLLDAGADVHVADEDGDSALALLCRNESITPALLRALLDAGAGASAPAGGKVAPLGRLCRNPSTSAELVLALVAAGADPNAAAADPRWQHALTIMCSFNAARVDAALVRALALAGADVAATLAWARGVSGSDAGARAADARRLVAVLAEGQPGGVRVGAPRRGGSSGAQWRWWWVLAVLLVVLAVLAARAGSPDAAAAAAAWDSASPTGGNPYRVLGVEQGVGQAALTKAYRKLARVMHPDRNRGRRDATHKFAQLANAYDVLSTPEKRDIFDRLGADGLQRLVDGDPRVKKGWLSDDEILRRLHNDPPQGTMDWLVTSAFAWLESKLRS
jgi:hypothetical protein